jgi:transposase
VVLSGLCGDEKDALIVSQQAIIKELRATVAEQQTMIMALQAMITELRATITQLEAKLAANSSNSNRPPSSDGLKKGRPKPHSLRQRTGKKPGGQPGHPGTTMAWAEDPDQIIVHAPPPVCDACNAPLPEPKLFASRQVFDLPEIRYDITEHRALESQCLCGKLHRGVFPDGVDAPMQYGPQVKGLAVYLTQQQMLPLQRSSELIRDVFDLSFCKGAVSQANIEAAELLTPVVDMIADALSRVPVAHADETGMRVEAKLHWMHTLVTPLLTWIGVHRRRGAEAMVHFDILPYFRGTLVHDGWESYRGFKDCIHSLCNAHHLRELKALAEDHKQPWAKQMGKLLQEACHEVNVNANERLTQERIAYYRLRYNTILRMGERKHPVRAASGKRGRTKQSSATNLLRRLRKHADDVWRFAADPEVPFTNNLAEQAVRMPKVKQKISGSFRTKEGAERFCTIRSYLETLRKQGHHLLDALTLAFQGNVPQPRLP